MSSANPASYKHKINCKSYLKLVICCHSSSDSCLSFSISVFNVLIPKVRNFHNLNFYLSDLSAKA